MSFEIEVVICEPVKKAISSWVWHNSTVRCVKESIEDQEGIPPDMQRLVYPGKGNLDDEFRIGHLLDGRPGNLGPPRLFLEEIGDEGQDEVADSEVQEPPSSVARAEVPAGLDLRSIDWTTVDSASRLFPLKQLMQLLSAHAAGPPLDLTRIDWSKLDPGSKFFHWCNSCSFSPLKLLRFDRWRQRTRC